MVFVLNKNKEPLSPCHPAKARKLLKEGKAVIHKKYPFTIRLKELKEVNRVFDISLSKELIETIKDNFVHTKDYTLKIHAFSNDILLQQFAKDCEKAFNIKTKIFIKPKDNFIFNDYLFEFSDNLLMFGQPDSYEFKLFYYILELILLNHGSGVSQFNMNKIKTVTAAKTLESFSKSSCSACYQLGKQMIQASFYNPKITSIIKIVDDSNKEFENEKFPILNIYNDGTLLSKTVGPINLFSKL